jgi:hypothetical protein
MRTRAFLAKGVAVRARSCAAAVALAALIAAPATAAGAQPLVST